MCIPKKKFGPVAFFFCGGPVTFKVNTKRYCRPLVSHSPRSVRPIKMTDTKVAAESELREWATALKVQNPARAAETAAEGLQPRQVTAMEQTMAHSEATMAAVATCEAGASARDRDQRNIQLARRPIRTSTPN